MQKVYGRCSNQWGLIYTKWATVLIHSDWYGFLRHGNFHAKTRKVLDKLGPVMSWIPRVSLQTFSRPCWCSVAKSCPTSATPWTTGCQASLSFTISQSLLQLMHTESVMPSNHLLLFHPLLFLPSIFPSIGICSNELALLIRWPKYWSFSFNISPSNEHPGLITFRMDWLDLLAVQGTLKSLLQHHSSKAPILRCSASFIVQLSHPHTTSGKITGYGFWSV